MVNVYSWPPVAHVAAEWTMIAPVGRSRSMITGASYVSAMQRRRRVARLDVSALSLDRNGAGYMEALKRYLDGGVHLVRLYSTPIIWHLDDNAAQAGRSFPMSWIVPPASLPWEVPTDGVEWWSGGHVPIGTASGTTLTVTGLPPLTDVVRPGEFVSLGGRTVMVRRPARSSAGGVAVIALVEPLTGSGAVVIGARETAVFEADEIPRSAQPLGQNWQYSWSFTEVFEDERGPFVEVDPWS